MSLRPDEQERQLRLAFGLKAGYPEKKGPEVR
jgi:hypothetical protein